MGKARKTYQLTQDEMLRLCEEAVDKAVAKYIHEDEKEKRRQNRKLLYNTKALLENYRKLKLYVRNAITNLDEVVSENIPDYYTESLEVFGLTIEDRRSYSIARSLANTTVLLNHVDRMLEAYRTECLGSGNPVAERRWQVVEMMYLQDYRMSTKDIADEMHMDPRAIQRDAERAREDLKVLIFGIDGLTEDLAEFFQ